MHSLRLAQLATLLISLAPLTGCLTGTQPPVEGGVAEGGKDGGAGDAAKATDARDAGPTTDATRAVEADGPLLDGTVALDAVADGALPSLDAGSAVDGAFVDGGASSRCTMTTAMITCTSESLTITTPAGTAGGSSFPSYARVVHYQVPLGAAPEAGWPVVFMFQGSFISAAYTFSASSAEEYGLYYQTELVKDLLDAGYAVLAPEALESGESYWETNIAPYAASWSGSADDLLIKAMLSDVAGGSFGKLDANKLFATGISSGGYMSSRMAVSYPGTFAAIAIESGSYATCLSGESAVTGGECTVPTLPSTHPPTLLLHGTEDTTIVPEWTVTAYKTALTTAGIAVNEIDDANSGHQWIPEAPAAVLAWFQKYP